MNYPKVIGLGVLITSHIMIIYTFVVAYLNGYSVTIYINNYGEAHIEMFLLLFTLPFVIYFIYVNVFNDGGYKYEDKS